MKNGIASRMSPDIHTGHRESAESRIVSVNVSQIKEVQFKGKTVPTGIFKTQVTTPVRISFGGVEDDQQADLRCHGGPHKAVYVYGRPGYDHWGAFLDRNLPAGIFGENLTVDDLHEDDVRIGDLLIIGDVILQVSEPRISCFKLAMTLQEDPGFSKIFLEDGRVGFYTRVLREGIVVVGDRFVHQRGEDPSVTVREFVRAAYDPNVSLSDLRNARNATGLSPDWRSLIAKRASALTLAKQPKAWDGFKRFIVIARDHEGHDVVSFYLSPADGGPLPAYLPGQHIVIRTNCPGYGWVSRSYSLSSAQPSRDALRVTIKRSHVPQAENQSASMSNHMHAAVMPGDVLDVRAPSGQFFCDEDDDAPLVLLAGGVGITPLFAMFEGAARSGCATTLVYAARNEAERAFRPAIENLCRAHPNLQALFLSEEAFESALAHNTQLGRVSSDIFRGLNLADADIFVCGPPGFLDAVEALALDAGVPDDRIHIEAFGARPGKQATTHIAYAGEHTVTFRKSGFEVLWTAEKGTLLDLAEANGLRPPFACRAGTCQSCVTRVVSGSLDYLELVDPPSPDETFVCCTIPTSNVVLDL